MIVINVIGILVTAWFAFSSLYIFLNSIAALFYKSIALPVSGEHPKVAVFIPAYKEDAVIVKVAEEALRQEYEGEFEVIVISDSLKGLTNSWLQQLPLFFLRVDFEKSTKAKALNFALKIMGDSFDIAIVLDADNVMEKGAIKKFARQYKMGKKAVQGHRCAKVTSSSFAILDAVSEEVNNHIYCKGPAALNLSSRLVGSGMSIEYKLFKSLMKKIIAVGGFDKDLELKIIAEGIKIEYAEDILIYDEKVDTAQIFQNQRTRWLSAQYYYLRKNFLNSFSMLFKGNFDYFYKVIQLSLPPRLLLPGFLVVGSFIFVMVGYHTLFFVWSTMSVLVISAYLIAIPRSFWGGKIIKIFFSIPKALYVSLIALLNISGANEKFIHTPHKGLEISGIKTEDKKNNV